MRVAFIFPGQGSQSVGMGKLLAEHSAQARAVFEEVDEALGQKLSSIIFDGPNEALTLTANAQPALMAVSIAVLRVMQAQGLDLTQKVDVLAGHSLGEYSALCAAGMFSLADTARLLRIRGDAMQQAVPLGKGAMAAIIGLEEEKVALLCKHVEAHGLCEIANDNGGGQLVVSGVAAAVERLVEEAKASGAKRALLLPVSAPFHCSLMQPAADRMKEALAAVHKSKPCLPIIANITAAPEQDPIHITDLLVAQVTGRVRWRETVDWFSRQGVETLYEIGAGKVLSGLARRINKDVKTMNVSSLQEIDEALKLLGV